MTNKYVIIMLCNDDGNYYTDYVNMMYNSEETAAEELKHCLEQEYNSLVQDSDTPEIYSKDDDTIYVNSNVLTRYSISQITKQEEEKENSLVDSLYRMYHSFSSSISKELLQRALDSFRYIFEIESDDAKSYACGSLVKLSRIIGKDFRNSDLLFKIADEFEKIYDSDFGSPLMVWEAAIIHVIGEEEYNNAFDEELPDIENIAQVFREYENQEFLNLSNCEVEHITNNEAMLGYMLSVIFDFLKDKGIIWDEIDMSNCSTDGYRFEILHLLLDAYKKY